MAKSNNQKGKILYLAKMMQDTGMNRVVSMQEILDLLLEHGIHAERKSIYDDIEVLRSFGMDIQYQRGRNGGYYLAGQAVREEAAKADREAWKKQKISGGSGKQMKLRCSGGIQNEVKEYLGGQGDYVQKSSGDFTVTTDLLEGAAFYGWLASLGKDIHIVKPKKAARSYRDYLKTIAREYKGV